MHICFFGTYKHQYARNNSLRQSLLQAGVTITEVHYEVSDEILEKPEDFTVLKSMHRVMRKAWLYIKLMRQAPKVWQADMVVVLHPGHLDLPLAWVLCKLGRKPLIFDSSVSPYDIMFVGRSIASKHSLKAKLVRWYEAFTLKLADKVFVDTHGMRDFIVETFVLAKKKIFVVPLSVNDQLYQPKATAEHKPLEVFFFGLYNPMHGAMTILEAIGQLRKHKHIHLTMLGDGYLKPELEAYAKENNLSNVTFVGFKPEAELVQRIQSCDIMLGIFSTSPVFVRVIPNKVIAAWACRKPLITADRPAMNGLARHGEEVYMCQPEDPQSLAQAILAVASNKKLRDRIAYQGHQLFLSHFSPPQIAKAFLAGVK